MVRSGARAARGTVVVHVTRVAGPSRAGFVVSKAVGNAVTRNRVKRQLRHLVAERFRAGAAQGPEGLAVVVRALPGSDTGPLREDFSSAWSQGEGRLAS